MRILITGDAGFIGRHLASELRLRRHDVRGVDYVRGPEYDLTYAGAFERAMEEHAPDVVCHLAAQYGRLIGEQDPEFTIRENVLMTTYVAQSCAERGVRVFYTSSSEVYGDQGETELTEETPPVIPHNLYGLTKRFGEEILRLYAPEGLQIARLSMPYGPGGKPGFGQNALHNVVHQAIYRKPIIVHKNAERSWVYVGDAVRALATIVESGRFGLWNVGREDQRTSMEYIARRACAITGCPTDLIHLVDPPPRQTVVKRMNADKLKREFAWKPRVGLNAGLPLTAAWLRKYDKDCQWRG